MPVSAHALIRLPFDALGAWLTAAPVWADHGRVEPDGTLHITFGIGTLRVAPLGAHSVLVVESADEAGLQTLRDFITDEAMEAGVAPIWQERHRPGRPANLCIARLEAAGRISTAFRRLWLRGEGLARLMSGGLHFRLLLGPEGSDWPWLDETGLTVWPGGAAAWHRPVYTVRSIAGEGAATRLSVDVFLHEGGRVTDWTARIRPGAEVALMGPSGGDVPEGSGGKAPWFGIFGDETALPAVARILTDLPPGAHGVAMVRLPAAADIQDLPRPPGIALRWLLRDSEGGADALVDALRATEVPGRDRFVFFSAGSAETAAAREVLAAKGLGKRECRVQAYWSQPGVPPDD